jgi:hypothetical protein
LRDHIGHCVIDREERIESGPQLNRPVKPDQVAVAQISDR